MTLPVALDLRPMRETDRNFVLSSWLRSYSAKSFDARDYGDRRTQFFDDYVHVVRSLLERSSVIVACLSEEPDVVVGWMAIEDDTLHYVLVKPRWRLLGVARWMLGDYASTSVVFTHMTRDASKCPIPPAWTFRRFRIWPKEKAA